MIPEHVHRNVKFRNAGLVHSERFEFFWESPEAFESWFEQNGKVVHMFRNELKILSDSRLRKDVVIKSFKVPGFFSKLIYSFFRPSKARRSYENSFIFLDKGFQVPYPLAYLEKRKSGLLGKSYFISELVDFDCTLHEVYKREMYDWSEMLPLVVEQAYLMHIAGLVHRDFSPGNVLIRKIGDGYTFSYVDLNRLRMGDVSFGRGLKSLVRLAHDVESQEIIARTYARLSNHGESEAIALMAKTAGRHRFVKEKKSAIKIKLGLAR